MIKLYDTFHTDIDNLQFRIVFSPPNGSDEWLVVLPIFSETPVQGIGTKVRTIHAIVDTIRIGNETTIVFIDKYEELFQRRPISPEVVVGSSSMGLGLMNTIGEYYSPSLRKVIAELQKFYSTNPFFRDVLNSTFTQISVDKTEPYPVFAPNTIGIVEILYNGEWYPISVGFIRGIATSLTKLGKTYRTVTVTLTHPFRHLFKLDFVHSIFSGLFTPLLLDSLDLTQEEKDIYLALWLGQYDNSFVDALSKTIRGVSLLQYFSLPEILHLIHKVGNLRLFAKYMRDEDHSEIYELLKLRGVVSKDLGYYRDTYNNLVKRFSALRYFADNDLDVFGELEAHQYIAPEGESLPQWFVDHVGIAENSFDFRERILPFRLIVDRDVASCNKSFGECTEYVKRLYKGSFSISFSMFLEKGNRKTIESVMSELSSVLQLDTYFLPNGWGYFTYPAMFKSLDNAVITTLKDATQMNHLWNADSMATVTSGYAGQDYIDINSDVLKKLTYWGIYIDVPNTVRYGMKEISAPTVYYPTWGYDKQFKTLWRKYLQTYQLVINSSNFSSTISYNNLILHPSVFYSLGNPVFVAGLDWIYTLTDVSVVFNFTTASLSFDLSLNYGVPMGLYDYIQRNKISPAWKVVRDTLDEIQTLNLSSDKPPRKREVSSPTSSQATVKKKVENHKPLGVNSISPADVDSIVDLTKGKPGISESYVDTVIDAISYKQSSPAKTMTEVIPNRYIMSSIEKVFQVEVIGRLSESYDFLDYEIVVDYESYYPKGYKNVELNNIGLSIKGVKLFKARQKGTMGWGTRFLGKLSQSLKEKILHVEEDDYLWIPIHTLDCKSPQDPYGIDWTLVAQNIMEEIYSAFDFEGQKVSVYSDVCGSLGKLGDIQWKLPWIKRDSGVWVFHCSKKFASMVKTETSLKHIVVKYGNVVSVIPADTNHCSDIYIMTSWNLTEVV